MTTPRQPGWYDDPHDSTAQRYWDGQDWTPHRQRKPLSHQTQAPVTSTPPQPPPPDLPPPPMPGTPTQSPITTKPPSGRSKAGFVIAGLALLLVIAALVAGRVLLGTFLPGLLLVGVIAILGVTVAVRSSQSVPRKAIIVTGIVLVVAVAVPASSKVVYPVYHHFFNDGTSQASPSSGNPASAPSSGPSGHASPPFPSSRNPASAPSSAPSRQASAPSTPAHSAPPADNFKIVVDGEDLTQNIVQFNQSHTPVNYAVESCANLANGTDRVTADMNNAVVLSHGAVTFVEIVEEPSRADPGTSALRAWLYSTETPHIAQGDAQLTKSGDVYQVTGHVTATRGPAKGGPPVPFEWDMTCP